MTSSIFCLLIPLLGGCNAYVDNVPEVGALLAQRARYNGRTVTVLGRVEHLSQRRARSSDYAYETFYVCVKAQCVRVFRPEHSTIQNDDRVRVRGEFFEAFHSGRWVYRNEIEATEIVALK